MKINVNYTPTAWYLDGTSFYCAHIETDTITVERMSPDYEKGDVDTYFSEAIVCTDCQEAI